MAWSFGDGFDLYTGATDPVQGYWDSGVTLATNFTNAGRFSGSRAYGSGAGNNFIKTSGVNDAVHHFCLAIYQNQAITGSSNGIYLTLYDGATAQCSVVFRTDGAILLTSGISTGTTLATYTGAFPVTTTWYQFEIEIVINNTTGSIKVRKNGNNVDDFSLGSLNTRASANNYANKLQFGEQQAIAHFVDDLFWRSDASSVAWMGDIRCFTRMPASDASVVFARTPTAVQFGQTTVATATTTTQSAHTIRATPVVAPAGGTLQSLTFNFNLSMTGHARMALYDNTGIGGGAGALLATSVELTNPAAGVNTFTVSAAPTVLRGVTYWVAIWSDALITPSGGTGGSVTQNYLAVTYTTSFPATLAGFTSGTGAGLGSNGMNVLPINAGCVAEAQQDATTSYVYSSTVNDADFYGISSISSTPATVIACTTRAYGLKSDAGTRTMAVQVKSGGTTVASPTLVLTTSGWQWAWRTDTVDPNTSAAWTPAAVNTVQIGPKVIA